MLHTLSPPTATMAEVLHPELPDLVHQVAEEIDARLPEYAGVAIRAAVEEALRHFLDQLAMPYSSAENRAKLFRSLGRAEYRAGRSLDSFQAASRISARIAWQHFTRVGVATGLDPRDMCRLAETGLTFIDEIVTYVREGYDEAQGTAPATVQRNRDRLFRMLLAEQRLVSRKEVARLASAARWRLPQTVTCVVAATEHDPDLPQGTDALLGHAGRRPCLLIPGALTETHIGRLQRAFGKTPFAVGPHVPLAQAGLSFDLAEQGLLLLKRGIVPRSGYIDCSDHLDTLLLTGNDSLIGLIGQQCRDRLAGITKQRQARLQETLLAWLSTRGTASEIGEHLRIHPQTVRYRMRQIEELFGPLLNDPEWRFRMQIVLRAEGLQGLQAKAAGHG